MPYASADGVDVYYEVHGEGTPLVFVHGSGGSHLAWYQQVPHFQDRFKVITIDLPGFGLSRKKEEKFDNSDFPPAILAVLDHAGVDKAILVSQSMGTVPVLYVTVNNPDRVIGAILGHSIGGIGDQEIAPAVAADRERSLALSVVDRLLSKELQENDPAKVFLFFQMGTFNQASSPQVGHSLDGKNSLQQVRDAIAAGVHVTFFQGTADAVVSPATYDRLRELLPEANVETVEGAPHSDYWESPELYNEALDKILAGFPALV
jgi:3-oxoadipate enol-lactonase